MRIVTWNVNSLKARIDRVEAWIQAVGPDVLCLQETKMADPAFPHERFEALGYESAHHGPSIFCRALSKLRLRALGTRGSEGWVDSGLRL